MKWTKSLIDELASMAAAGMTSTAIAAAMGATRNMVIGKARREGIPLISRVVVPRLRRRRRIRKPRPPKPKLAPVFLPTLPPLLITGAGPAVLALNLTDCRWPIGDPTGEDFRFCCEPRDPHASPPYCAAHTERATRGGGGW